MKKKAEIKKTGLFSKYTDHQTIKMDFIYGDDFVFVKELKKYYKIMYILGSDTK